MNMTQLRENLRKTYNKYAQERESSRMQDWKIEERSKFLSLLQKQGKQTLLEIGAGTGRDSKFFQDQGLEVVCIDLSPVMVKLCRQKGLKAHVMDMTDIQLPPDSFDALYSMNSLLHLAKNEFSGVLLQLDKLLRADGVVFIGMYGGKDYEGVWENDSYDPKRFFSFFTDERLKQEVMNVFDIVSFESRLVDPEDTLYFQALTLRKRSSVSTLT